MKKRQPPLHVGEILADELEERGLNAAQFAKILNVPANRISQILNGKRSMSADTALRVGKYFGTGPGIWMRLQQRYELDLAEDAIGDALKKIPTRKPSAHIMESAE